MKARRILVVGSPASGKSTFSRALAESSQLPLVVLDDEYFGPGWTHPEPSAWDTRLRWLLEQPDWIIDGNHSSSFAWRLRAAELVVVVERSRWFCLANYVRRAAKLRLAVLRGSPGPGMPHYMIDGRKVRVTDKPLRFMRFIFGYPAVLAEMERSLLAFDGEIVRLRSFSQFASAVAALSAASGHD